MSELKFRAWQRHHKEMFEVGAIQFREPRFVVKLDSLVTWELNEVELMQYTGLKDKGGREIYEGDIVKADWHWDKPHQVIWPNDYYGLIEYGLDAESNLEVIGNIYENPELLLESEK